MGDLKSLESDIDDPFERWDPGGRWGDPRHVGVDRTPLGGHLRVGDDQHGIHRAAAPGRSAHDGPDERSRRLARLGFVEAAFGPIPIDPRVARAWGALAVLDDVVDVRIIG
jgi:hypothetical protein